MLLRNPNKEKILADVHGFGCIVRCNRRAGFVGGDGFSVPSVILIAAFPKKCE